jgi:pyruvate, water dikinase
MPAASSTSTIAWFSDLGLADIDQVGGKNASLGEMVGNLTSAGVRVPNGFATTADAYRHFIFDGGLAEMINAELAALDTDDVEQLAAVGRKIREAVAAQPFPANLEADIRAAYAQLADESEGRAIGQKIGAGAVRVLRSVAEMHHFNPGEVLVADMTDPDWEPIMKRAAAIVTNRGGRTCHAAIIARELGIPAVVGTGAATTELQDSQPVTVSCAEGDTGYVYGGLLDFAVEETEQAKMPEIDVKIMMNVGTPDQAFAFSRLPNAGVGLARLEFIINNQIGIHPKALLEWDLLDEPLRSQIGDIVAAYETPRDFFVRRVAEGVATIAAAFAPHPAIVRMSDFKSNEYASLLGGDRYEPHEENPMIGFRGASRYVSPDFVDCFAMECEALRYVRDTMGLTNVKIMIPFVRTLTEADGVIQLLAQHGLRRGDNDLEVIMMCELPSNAVLADAFLDHFDGFSIGSNDLTQLTLGLDRDSSLVAATFDERDPAVKSLISSAISACKARGKYVGICGQGPSDHPDLAEWLLEQGIDSISLNPDTVVDTWIKLGRGPRE